MLNFLKNISSTELIILAVIFIVLFGSRAFIALGRTGGQTLKEIKKLKKTVTDPVEQELKKDN